MQALTFLSLVLDFIQKHPILLTLVVVVSLFIFIASIALLPILAAAIPEDYFFPRKQRILQQRTKLYGAFRVFVLILKNFFGFILLIAGLIMLVTPGQGLLTIFFSFLFINFPGKRRLELALVRRPSLYRAITALRRMRGRPPLRLPDFSF